MRVRGRGGLINTVIVGVLSTLNLQVEYSPYMQKLYSSDDKNPQPSLLQTTQKLVGKPIWGLTKNRGRLIETPT